MSGTFLYHTNCDTCGSSDALAVYEQEDGKIDGTCFSCNRYTPNPTGDPVSEDSSKGDQGDNTRQGIRGGGFDLASLGQLPIVALSDRGISKEACKKYGVRASFNTTTGELDRHFYPVSRNGNVVGYKERVIEEKKFKTIGDCKGPELFGQSAVKQSGKLLIITEGECDALAVQDMLWAEGKDYNVVSIPNGSSAAKRSVQDNFEFVDKFESVCLVMDQDDPGKKAAKEIAELLAPGKAKIASLPEKDPNDMLRKDMSKRFLKCVWGAKEYRPDGIVRLSQSWDDLWVDESIESVLYPWDGLNKKLYGMRPREIVTITSGSGLGKSAIVRELEYNLFKRTEANIGILALEESVGRTQWGVLSIEANKPLAIREERAGVTRERIKEYWDRTIGTGRFISYDHFGSTSADNLINKVRYLVKAMECQWIILDHLSIVVSSMEDGGDERRTIDAIMTQLRQLTEETGAGLVLVSHLRRPGNDKGHERGAEVTLNQLRGSHSIAQLSDAVIGLERDQQSDDERKQNLTKVVVLKSRYSGFTGAACNLFYNRDTGRLYEVADVEDFLEDPEYELALPEY